MDERTEKNREIALRLVKAVGSGDMPVVESLVHPDLDWWLNGMGHLDHDAFIASLHMLHSAKSGGFTVVTSTAEADRVVIELVGDSILTGGRRKIGIAGYVWGKRSYQATCPWWKVWSIPISTGG